MYFYKIETFQLIGSVMLLGAYFRNDASFLVNSKVKRRQLSDSVTVFDVMPMC